MQDFKAWVIIVSLLPVALALSAIAPTFWYISEKCYSGLLAISAWRQRVAPFRSETASMTDAADEDL